MPDLALADHKTCTLCPLHVSRLNVVPGFGDPSSPLVFVGEAPDADEDMAGLPWVGQSGLLLRSLVDAMPLTSSD